MNPPNHPTRIVAADAGGVAEAAAAIRAGQCVAVPTETVYGLAADATDAAAVARIYQAKGRPSFNPLIVHVENFATAAALALFDERAGILARRFWPGPLTLVLPGRQGSPVASAVTAGLPTVAVRVPAHPVMQALLREAGRPLAAPSANRSGGISPTTAGHVLRSLGGRIPLVLDGGATSAGLESSIVAVTDGLARLLRPGPLTADELGAEDTSVRGIEAPGQLASHYKPQKPLILGATAPERGTWLIGFGTVPGDATLSARGDLAEAAAALYARLHEADASRAERIAVAPVPEIGIGVAINDRLRRAAAPG